MKGINVILNFEELDKLSSEQYNELERRYLKYFTKLITSAEEDYCRKKGVKKEEILKDYKFYSKMRKAINQRKSIKQATETCMKFNKLLRRFVFDGTEVKR